MNRNSVVTAVLAVVGVGALTLSIVVALAPGLLPVGALTAILAPLVANPALVALVAVGLAVLPLYRVVAGSPRNPPSVTLPDPPSARDHEDVETAGEWVDDRLAKVRGDQAVNTQVGLAITRKRVIDRVEELAIDVITDTESCSRTVAREKLREGAWTDRPRARVLLGGEAVDDLPLAVRIRDWASGEAFERRVRAAVGELAEMAGVETEGSLAPDPATVESDDTPETTWQPDEDLRSRSDWTDEDGELDPGGLYRREMFEEADAGDGAASAADVADPEGTTGEPPEDPEQATGDREEAVEMGGDRT